MAQKEVRKTDKRRDVEKLWRKGDVAWRFTGDHEGEADSEDRRRSAPRRVVVVDASDERDALVVQTGGPVGVIEDATGRIPAHPRRTTTTENPSSTLIVIGDRVRYIHEGDGDAVITHVYARTTSLSRRGINQTRVEQVIAANVDQLVVVAAATQEQFRPGLIDRYLIAAAMGGITPLVLINKIDLADDEAREYLDEAADDYRTAGYRVIMTSCTTNEGLADLRSALLDSISSLVGQSGVGKTTLLNALIPDLDEKTADVSVKSGRGTHTTTRSTLYALHEGGYIADTPGIREYGLYHFDRDDLHTYYPEFVPLSNDCRLSSCTHIHEPDCAVRDAVERGTCSALRYRNYLQIHASEDRGGEE